MDSWTPAGAAVVIIAACLGIGWVSSLMVVMLRDTPLTREGVLFLGGLGQTLAGALAVLLGVHMTRHAHDDGHGHGGDR